MGSHNPKITHIQGVCSVNRRRFERGPPFRKFVAEKSEGEDAKGPAPGKEIIENKKKKKGWGKRSDCSR